jgi:preprotein translocase subunit YajC
MFATVIGGMTLLLAFLFLVPLAIAIMVFWIWMLVDAIQNKGLGDGEKVGWVLAIVFFHFIGSILYFFIGRPKRKVAVVA